MSLKTKVGTKTEVTGATRIIEIKDGKPDPLEVMADHRYLDQVQWDNEDGHDNWVTFFKKWPFVEPPALKNPNRFKISATGASDLFTVKETHSIDKYPYAVKPREPRPGDVAGTRNPPQIIVGP